VNRRRGPRIEMRVLFVGFCILCGLGALVAKLWWVQVARGPYYASKIANRSEVTVRIPPVRGEIRDRNGVTLVQNRASYDVDFYLPDMVHSYKQRSGGAVPKVTYRATARHGMLKNREEADVVQIVNSTIIPRLQDLKLAQDYNADRLQRHYRTNDQVPFVYLEDIDFKTIALFSEHNVGLPGVDISIRPVRQYLYGALAAHLLGYVGMPQDISTEPDSKSFNFYQPDADGKSNIEQAMDKWLRGTPGVRKLQRNVKGQIEGEAGVQPPKPGNNVYLTIDARIQMIAEKALRSVGRGAAVVVDPNNGEILAMASVPSFNPNLFIPSIASKDWKVLNDNEANPLVNRATSAFPPGSTFKLVTSLAGLRTGHADAHFNCGGGVSYGDHFFHCWIAEKGGSHGVLGLADAIKVSCNSFFYQYGNLAGIDAIDKTGEVLGLGQPADIGLSGVQAGVLPGPAWMSTFSPREKWSSAYTANVSIGQGYDLETPLQNAMVYATVANGGVSYYPRLVKKVLTPDGQVALDENGQPAVPDEPKIRGDLRHDFTQAQIDLARRGLWKVVNEDGGTGGRARLKEVTVAGKTGTATAKRKGKPDTIGWFCCFAPFEKPRYAICVMVNGAEHGGSVAAPIATKILSDTLAMESGKQIPELVWLDPANQPDPFKMIAAVDFKNEAPALGNSQDEEKLDASQSHGDAQLAKVKASPDIREAADDRGRVRNVPAQRAKPPEAQREKLNFFQRIFRSKKQ
jgi:penicillin-binding protein 2